MVDFHSHIIFNIDDGSKDEEMSLNMLRQASEQGIKYVCATPHYIDIDHMITKQNYIESINKLKKINTYPIEIVAGLEVYINDKLHELWQQEKIWGINNTKYLLVEFPMNGFPIYAESVFYELRLLGVVPIIAHPERNSKFISDINLLKDLVEQGALIQLNAGSLTGKYGKTIKEFAHKLVKMNMVTVLGSDSHNDSSHKCALNQAIEIINKIDENLYESIEKNEYNILQGNEVESLPIKDIKKNIFSFFKKS